MPIPGNLPKHGQEIFERVMNSLKGKKNPRTGKAYTDEERGRIAWSAVKNKYKKVGDKWEAKTAEEERIEEELPCSEIIEFKSEDGKYYFKGYLSTFDLDLVNDIVTPDCMKDMLNQINVGLQGFARSVKGSADHDVYWTGDSQKIPISKITNATVDNRGLFVEGMFNIDHPEFKQIWNQVENGFLDGLSIEYRPVDFSFKDMDGKKIRVLNKLLLKGYGHTPRPANPYSTLTDFFVKSIIEEDIKEFDLVNMIKSHLQKDMEEYKSMIKDDEELTAKLDNPDIKSTEVDKVETKEETKIEPQPQPPIAEVKSQPVQPQVEVKTEVKEEKVEVKTEEKKEEVKVETPKVDAKSLEEQIKAIVKEELKSLVPEKKNLPDTSDKFAEVKSENTDLISNIVRGLGGR